MESELRSLIGKYGMRAVHEGLMKEMRDTFQYLQCVFELKNEIISPPIQHTLPTVEVANDIIPGDWTFHTETHAQLEEDSLTEEEEVPEPPKDPSVKEIKIQQKAKPAILSPPTIDVKQQKASHKEEVEKKKQELLAKGVKPESLLTEANLRKWLGDGWSYMKIAKETGIPEAQVATVSKSFGLQSNISRYVALKKKT